MTALLVRYACCQGVHGRDSNGFRSGKPRKQNLKHLRLSLRGIILYIRSSTTRSCGSARQKPKNLNLECFSKPHADYPTEIADTAVHDERGPLDYHHFLEPIRRSGVDCRDPYLAVACRPEGPWQHIWVGRTPLQHREVGRLGAERTREQNSAFDWVDTTPYWSSWTWRIDVAIDPRPCVTRGVELGEADGRDGEIGYVWRGDVHKHWIY